MASFADGKIEAFVGPVELGAADDLEDVIVGFIDAATASLSVAVQELDDYRIARAILAAHWRGVRVELFLEQDYLRPSERPKPKATAGETLEQAQERLTFGPDESELAANREILTALLRAGIEVHGDFNPKIFHQKFIVRDFAAKSGGGVVPALLSGSANFTDTDCHRNLNHVVVFHDRNIAAEYQAQFEQLRAGQFGRGTLGAVPTTRNLAGVPVKVLFAPDDAPELELIKQMLKAGPGGLVRFAIFTFTGSSAIDDAMLMLARAGCQVRGALDKGQGRQSWSALPWLRHPNIKTYFPHPDWNVRKLHHKLLVIEEHTVVAGSFNYTEPANNYNDENLFVIGSPHDEVDGHPVDHQRCREIAEHLGAEIDRIISHSEPAA